jgi:hypothetical protein
VKATSVIAKNLLKVVRTTVGDFSYKQKTVNTAGGMNLLAQ